MYRIPKELDLSPIVGESNTQIRVGQYGIQFTFGCVDFAVQSPVRLFRDGAFLGLWEEGKWPAPAFFDVMNSVIIRCEILSETQIAIIFENGLEML